MCLLRRVPRGLSPALIGPFRRRRDLRTPQVRGVVVAVGGGGWGLLGGGRVGAWLAGWMRGERDASPEYIYYQEIVVFMWF